ncbi:response regulator [Gorillibacterium sp. sgz5001074]|uniref:response regulator n=1 Tax=Gorillibacterium sp. sgz5001074 TaxID=3446695 RepID=UPI003F666933
MLKALIADDEPIVLEGLRWMIDWKRLGFELVGEACDGEEALKLMEECRPDLIMTDIRMPVIDGLALIRQASERYPRTKCIILSGYADFEYARQAARYGASNYITKPLDEEELEKAVEAAAEAIRCESAELRSRKVAEAHIREETVTRLLLGDTREEWVRSARLHLNLGEHTRVRCLQLLPGKDGVLQTAGWCPDGAGSLEPGLMVLPFRITREHQGVILASGSAGPSLSAELVSRVAAALRPPGQEPPYYSVSTEHRGPYGLHRSYQEAVTAGICKLPTKEEGVYLYQDKLLKNAALPPEELKASILQAIAGGNPEGVRHFSKACFAAISGNQGAEGWSGAYLSTVKLEALKVLLEHGADVEEWTKRWFAAAPYQDPGVNQCRWIKELVAAAEWVAAGKGARTDTTVQAALDYIKLHYQEKMQLQHIADRLHLNPAYLGQRFKKQLGVPFHEYLHSVRIEEAKKLLRRTDLKIADIAARVGYPDTDSFTSKFKAITGMLPSVYKKD